MAEAHLLITVAKTKHTIASEVIPRAKHLNRPQHDSIEFPQRPRGPEVND
jgi:hypothetical protein